MKLQSLKLSPLWIEVVYVLNNQLLVIASNVLQDNLIDNDFCHARTLIIVKTNQSTNQWWKFSNKKGHFIKVASCIYYASI